MTEGWRHEGLTPRQSERLDTLFCGARIVADHSWPFGITVLEFEHAGRRYILKASEASHHLVREYRAHLDWLGPLHGDVPEVVDYQADVGLLVKDFLPGHIALGSERQADPGLFEQAGRLLRRLHAGGQVSVAYETAAARKTARWLERAAGLAPSAELHQAQAWLAAFKPTPVEVVPTHGDFQPRNWLIRPHAPLALIDFGRADLRPWYSDLVRLELHDFVQHPELRSAFDRGYGADTRVPVTAGRRLEALMQSLGTIVWAHEMSDAAFEEHGRRMLSRVLAAGC